MNSLHAAINKVIAKKGYKNKFASRSKQSDCQERLLKSIAKAKSRQELKPK